jgi:hypothetical protein
LLQTNHDSLLTYNDYVVADGTGDGR